MIVIEIKNTHGNSGGIGGSASKANIHQTARTTAKLNYHRANYVVQNFLFWTGRCVAERRASALEEAEWWRGFCAQSFSPGSSLLVIRLESLRFASHIPLLPICDQLLRDNSNTCLSSAAQSIVLSRTFPFLAFDCCTAAGGAALLSR